MDFDQISILSPLELSLRVASLATLFSFVAATLMAWLLARKEGPCPPFWTPSAPCRWCCRPRCWAII